MTDSLSGPRPIGRGRALLIFAAIFALAALTDQLSKVWALSRLSDGQEEPLLGDFLSLRLLLNPGASFSLGSGVTWVFTALSLGFVVAVWWWALSGRLTSGFTSLGLALVGGGALGNLLDRLFRPPSFGHGHVVDFIDYGGFVVGNVADIWIFLGVALLLADALAGELRSRRSPTSAGDGNE